jgi:AcrR family transcriptional regulator
MKKAKRMRNKGASELALLQAAATLFSEQGMTRTTTRQIAAKAGRAEGLISRYFHGKKGLAQAVEENAEKLLIPSTQSIPQYCGLRFDSLLSADLNPAQKLTVNRIKAALANEFERDAA